MQSFTPAPVLWARAFVAGLILLTTTLLLTFALPASLRSLVEERDALQGLCQNRPEYGNLDVLKMLGTRELAGCEIGDKANTIRAFACIFLILLAAGVTFLIYGVCQWNPRGSSAEEVVIQAVKLVGQALLGAVVLSVIAIVLFMYAIIIAMLYMVGIVFVIAATTKD